MSDLHEVEANGSSERTVALLSEGLIDNGQRVLKLSPQAPANSRIVDPFESGGGCARSRR